MKKLPAAVTAQAQTSDYVDEWWMLRHQAKLDEVALRRDSIDLVMIGDSITQEWEVEGEPQELWAKYIEPRNAINLGFSGDRTEQVLWRLQNGEIDGLAPSVVVLLIGTNNTGHREDPAEETAAGIKAILDELRTRLPRAQILLVAVFPRGESPDDPLRLLNAGINDIISAYVDGKIVHLLEIGHKFVDASGMLDTRLMPDLLHLSPPGYKVWADSLVPLLDELRG